MAALDRFNAIYSPIEDRILLQAVGDGWTQNFWMTRHVLMMFGNVCASLLNNHYTSLAQQLSGSSSHAEDFAQFGQDASLSENPPRSCAAMDGFTEAPLLVYEIRYKGLGQGAFAIFLSDSQGQGHGYQLQETLLNALINLLQTQADQAGWGIRLRPTIQTPIAATQGDAGKRSLH